MVFSNNGNSSYQKGGILNFTTVPSTETTLAATAITSSSAILNGTVNPAGSAGWAYFEWDTDPTLSSPSTTAYQAVTANFTTQPFSAAISYLTTNTTYYYRMVFNNGGNGSYQRGGILSLTPEQATVVLSPTSVAFGNQLLKTTLSNSNTSALLIGSIGPASGNSSDFGVTNVNCPLSPSTLAGGTSCTINVTFKPTASGVRKSLLTITDNAVGSPQKVVLTGIGTVVSMSPASLTFPSQAIGVASGAMQVTLTNAGSTALNVWGMAIGATNSGDFGLSSNCPVSPATLAGGANCTISVTFTPTATGTRTASLLVSDDGGGSPQVVPLLGTGM
jgi:hypothetical protein